MYYSAIGLLAVLILLIENYDIIFNRSIGLQIPVWKSYRRFLLAVLMYYVTDILWGILESCKLRNLLFADTLIYYIAMALGLLFWTKTAVIYLDDQNAFGVLLRNSGRGFAIAFGVAVVGNIFTPVLFWVDDQCVYQAYPLRYVFLIAQIVLLLLAAIYAFSVMKRRKNISGRHYRTVAYFGLIMAVFLFMQLWFPLLPLYTVAYMLGTGLLHTFVINDEKEEYKRSFEEAKTVAELKQSISTLLDNMPGMSFSKDAKTGVYLACNQAFAEYAHKENPQGVAGLTDAQIFDPDTAKHFVEDDQMALSMDKPYIFFEDVPDAAGNPRQFQTTKLKFIDHAGRLCLLGMCTDVTDMVRIRRENATTKEAYEKARSTSIIYSYIAQTLARSYMNLFYVNLETEEFIEYLTDNENDSLVEARRGIDFFEECRLEAQLYVHPEDRAAFMNGVDRETLLKALNRDNTFLLTYRLMNYHTQKDTNPIYVTMKVSRMAGDENFLIIAVTDVDEQMKQRRAAEQAKEEHIAYSRINALSGDILCIYVVNPETGQYREYSASTGFETYALPKEGMDFFSTAREKGQNTVYPDDLKRFLTLFTKEGILSEIEHSGIFAMSYRLIMNGRPIYIQLKAAIVEEAEGARLIVGLNDIDSLVRQEQEYEKRLAQAQSIANLDPLTGVKNRHAYLAAEDRLDRMIGEHRQTEFAVVILDVNDLKKVNDAEGHQAGDQYLKDACSIICRTFKCSPVYRVGGDEFAVIVQDRDYLRIEELMGKMNDHNMKALRSGGIVIACGMSRFEYDNNVASVFERADLNMYENKRRLKES